MSRSSIPCKAQVEKLLDCLEERRYLATGYARTTHARERTRAAWQDVALKLNSDASGCFKTWQQWAKYWKDKKAGVKIKASKVRMAKLSGGESDISLTVIERRIVGLMGGALTNADKELAIDAFHPSTAAVDTTYQIITNPTQAEDCIILNIQDNADTGNATPGTDSILQRMQPGAAPTIQFTATLPLDGAAAAPDTSTSPVIAPHRSGHVASAALRRRRRRAAASGRRRVATLTQRFLAIEEKRVQNEASIIENQKNMYEIFFDISKAMCDQTQAIQELCRATRALTENRN